MSYEQDPNDLANISGADLAILVAERDALQAENTKLHTLRHEREDVISELRNEVEAQQAELERLNACLKQEALARENVAAMRAELAAQLAAAQGQERALRRLFCASVSLGAYMDDGEASDASEWPHIDYLRDSPDDIRRKRQERGMKKLAAPIPQQAAEPAQGQDLIEVMCARIKAADDAMADCDYMLDSADCISVIRGTWKSPMLNDKPAAPIPQQVAEPSVLIGEMRDNGVVWFNRNPHAWPLGTTYYAAAPQPKDMK